MYRFEKLEIWQIARTFVQTIYQLTRLFPKDELFALTAQIRRAAISIMLNIAEGTDRGSDIDFARFLRIAYGSLNEVIAGCYIALDQGYIDKMTFDRVYNQSHQLGKKINAFIQILK